jgi:hypothetical protein
MRSTATRTGPSSAAPQLRPAACVVPFSDGNATCLIVSAAGSTLSTELFPPLISAPALLACCPRSVVALLALHVTGYGESVTMLTTAFLVDC